MAMKAVGVKKKKLYDETKKICRYIFKPAIATAIIAGGLTALVVIGLVIGGVFESFIVSMDIKYNSPVIIGLACVFAIVMFGACGYGIFLSLHKYRRPGGKGIFNIKYSRGSSYRALNAALNESNSIERDMQSNETE